MAVSSRTLLRSAAQLSSAVRVAPTIARTRSLVTVVPRLNTTSSSFARPTSSSTLSAIRFKSTDSSKSWGPPIVPYEELKPITQQPSDDILVVDVREPDEVALGSIPSAVSLPLSVLKNHLSTNFSEGEFRKEHAFPKPLKDQKIIFFCRSGKRSASACQFAQEEGYKNVRNYEGSWLDWTRREKEAEQGQSGYKGDDDDD